MIRLTLYRKLLSLASSIGLITVIIVLISFYSFNVLNERDKLRIAETTMLRAYQLRLEFSRHRDLDYYSKFNKAVTRFDSIMKPYGKDSEMSALIAKKDEYENLIDDYIAKMKIRGLNENLGLEGHFRESVHNIEDIISKTNNYKIYVYMLQARRSEKDFIMRRKDQYVDRNKRFIDSLIKHTSRLELPGSMKDDIIHLSETYLSSFGNLVDIFQTLDSLENQIHQYENGIKNQLEMVVDEKAAYAELIQYVQLVVVILATFFIVFISIVIARGITKPVVRLQEATHRISQGDFDTHVEVRTGDEIEDLANTFNGMVDNIRRSNKTILTQQNKLREKNTQLESLATDLKSSFDNLSVLSNIGQSITSTLSLKNIFEKLYIYLKSTIDSSTFGIGLFDRENDLIDYQLMIKNTERQEPLQVDMNKTNRLDVICLKNGEEIQISDMEKESDSFVQKYKHIHNINEIYTLVEDSMSAFYLLITIENRSIGILSIESPEKNAYGPHHLDMLRNLTSYVAIAILNAQSFEEIKKSHDELKKTQNQLIQAEKMASLGQLTTGIAHEIKNPLNFINNYSDGSVELCKELIEDFEEFDTSVDKKHCDYLKETIEEISEHLDTIHKNGLRIDKIVKSMMEHARGGTGEIVPTDINALLKEYVKLGYNGFRGQHINFIANIKYDLRNDLPEIPLRKQDISRVLTNIIDNACYSLFEKANRNGHGYHPELYVKTSVVGDNAEISIRDNGLGIPDEIINKVFNPFFTTKPTGEGTGLGLSLSYDIIKNGHHGEMYIESEENKFAEFKILLPLENSN